MCRIFNLAELEELVTNGQLADHNFIKLKFDGGSTYWDGKDFNNPVPTMIPKALTIQHYRKAAEHFKNGLIDAVNGELLIAPAVR
ncbi:MAG: hypothetical protein ABW007_03065 [Chitinophagaceae bacterium]